jgi:cysteine-rich repeat protein
MRREVYGKALRCARIIAIGLMVGLFGGVHVLHAATLTVNDLEGEAVNDNCQLREAMMAIVSESDVPDCLNTGGAYGNEDRIEFDANITETTIFLESALPTITKSLTIAAPAQPIIVRKSGGPLFAIFTIDSPAGGIVVSISGLTISFGSGGSNGGGISIAAGDTLNLDACVISDNTVGNRGAGILNSGTINISDCTITRNTATTHGGGIYNKSGGTVNITNSTISDNTAGVFDGGGLYSQGGTVNLSNVTISGNDSSRDGGGVFVEDGIANLNNVTIADNHAGAGAADSGGGVMLENGTLSMANTIIANNTAGGPGPDCWADPSPAITSLDYNLIGTTADCLISGEVAHNVTGDPLLGPLQDNGGPTLTHAISESSPAFDSGNPDTPDGTAPRCMATDQRGTARPQHGRCDIGAYEIEYCGNGVTDEGETCDDSNEANGDCCSAICQFEAAGSACDDGDPCTPNDACNDSGVCAGGTSTCGDGGGGDGDGTGDASLGGGCSILPGTEGNLGFVGMLAALAMLGVSRRRRGRGA